MGDPLKPGSNCEAERTAGHNSGGRIFIHQPHVWHHCQKLSSWWHRSFGTETELHTSCIISLGFEMMVDTFPTGLMQVQVLAI
jgi:hypothetical protein